jgi:aconitase A
MLSSVLHSRRAITVNIEIMRAFVKLRRVLDEHRDLARRLDDLEQRYDSNFQVVFDAIRKLVAEPARPQRRIGYLKSAAAG